MQQLRCLVDSGKRNSPPTTTTTTTKVPHLKRGGNSTAECVVEKKKRSIAGAMEIAREQIFLLLKTDPALQT